jgi:multiple sugar transport system ATP-binding protein
MARVALEFLSKTYPGGVQALDRLTLDVADGELVVLVGPSGCGKSTVLRLVAGLEEATSGTIRIGDRVANALDPKTRNVAMVFQDYALYPHLTARENLEFPLRMRGLAAADRRARVERVAASLDIASLLDRLPKALSGGQRQRVAMGRALVREPAAFLMDEPLSNLDAKLRVQVRAELKTLLRDTRTTTFYVTHDQVEAMTLGDRVAVLDHGRLQQVAPPREVYTTPANAFVAGFMGNPPMNLFPARLDDQDGRLVLRVGDQTLPAGDRPRAPRRVPLTAGVRPEAFRVGTDGLRAVVEHVENLGHETLVYARAGDVTLVARVAGMPELAVGSRVALGVEPASIYLFDADGAAVSIA